MIKLTAGMQKRHDELFAKLDTAKEGIEKIEIQINALIERELSYAVVRYNDAISECVEFRDEVVTKMNEYIEERPEAWGESDAGSSYVEWKDEWECIELEPLDVVESIIAVEGDTPTDFGNLDTEPR